MSKLCSLLSLLVMIAIVPLASCGGQQAEESSGQKGTDAEQVDSEMATTDETESAETAAEASVDSSGFKTMALKGFHLRWKVEGESLRVNLKTETTGWLAVGFDPTTMMQDANLIIGYVKDGKLHARDDYGSGRVSHQPDIAAGGTSDIYELAGTEEDGFTELSFVMPMDSGDTRDRPLVEGNEYGLILSKGPNGADDFTTKHTARVDMKIKL
jgi:hypothetical protein